MRGFFVDGSRRDAISLDQWCLLLFSTNEVLIRTTGFNTIQLFDIEVIVLWSRAQ